MSESSHNKPHVSKGSQGTTQSYVIGFILSLFFTANAYYLVVSKTYTGYTLLLAILGFAILQMAVQIFFFLHLGRGPKPLYNIIFFASTVGIIIVVVLGSIFIMNNLHYNMAPADVTQKLTQDEGISQIEGQQTGACQEVYANHQVIISDGNVIPLDTEASVCDTLTFYNKDVTAHNIVFGEYPYTQSYAGNSDQSVRKNFSKTITLNKVGFYEFYDKINPAMKGTFRVTPR